QGKVAFKFEGKATDITGISGVRARTANIELTTQCTFRGESKAQNDQRRVCLAVDADLEIDVPGSTTPLKATGGAKIDLTTMTYEVSGGLPQGQAFGPKEFHLTGVHVFATNAQDAATTCQQVASQTRTPALAEAAAGSPSYGFTASGVVGGV